MTAPGRRVLGPLGGLLAVPPLPPAGWCWVTSQEPWHRVQVGPENLSVENEPGSVCFYHSYGWKFHSEVLFAVKLVGDQKTAGFSIVEENGGQPMFIFLSPFRETEVHSFLPMCGFQTNSGPWKPIVMVREHPGMLGAQRPLVPSWPVRVGVLSSRPTVGATGTDSEQMGTLT